MSVPSEADALCLRLFPHDGDASLSRVIEAHSAREEQIVAEWHALCAASFGAHRGLCEEFFQEFYVPGLRDAYMCLWRRDSTAFVRLGKQLGEKLARADLPFVSFVAYLHLLKKSYEKVLGDQPDALAEVLRHVDSVHAALVSLTADGYYRALASADAAEAEAAAASSRTPVAHETTEVFAAIPGMVGRSGPMQQVFRKIARVATYTSPVLVIGETGTGKELVARAIHALGPRHGGPFIAVNCAALPRELIESELFGYRRGAFSGAVTEYLGLFRAAAGGTLLLDEVTEMAPELQAKLLRVLQDRTVRPVGTVTEMPIDVRIIASTNRDPETAMASGVLRPDLYYRLSSSRVTLPPLRARPDDIPLLAEHFVGVFGARRMEDGATLPRVSADAMRALAAQPWPGNVRELFNVLEETLTMLEGSEILSEHLSWMPGAVPVSAASSSPAREGIPTLAASERALIERALSANDGNKLRAARQLGISRTKLYAKIAQYGLCAPNDAVRRIASTPRGRLGSA